MQAVILAAGLGKRLGAATRHSTKCMVELNGRRLVEYALDALIQVGVERIVVVVGHGADEVRAFLGREQAGIPVHYVTNPIYAETNNVYSLLLARDHLERDDTLLLESDVIFESEILLACAAHPAPNVAVVAAYEPWMDGTVTVLNQDQRVIRIVSKCELSSTEVATYYKTVNLYKLSRAFSRGRFMPFLAAYVEVAGRGHYYEDVLRALVYMGADDLVALPVGDRRWYEIDDVQDLDIASVLFAPAEERYDRLQRRYGGFWRFPQLNDFTYLVNPYFPPVPFREELAEAAPRLATMYPSGLSVQRSLAAGLFRCDPDQVLVGNGAAELIASLLAEIAGPVGVPVPTFEEYPKHPDVVLLSPPSGEPAAFRHDLDDLARACGERSLKALVLVNPNNPTGQVFCRECLLALLDDLRPLGTRLVLDESFVDFVDGRPGRSLLIPTRWRATPTWCWCAASASRTASPAYGWACSHPATMPCSGASPPGCRSGTSTPWPSGSSRQLDGTRLATGRPVGVLRRREPDSLPTWPACRPCARSSRAGTSCSARSVRPGARPRSVGACWRSTGC